MIEVELKARIQNLEEEEKKIINLGFSVQEMLIEEDVYFNGNNRNFHETDEALRLRVAFDLNSKKEISILTYKGPKLDEDSQSRVEYESVISDYEAMNNTLHVLGYISVFKIRKKRKLYKLDSITACLDNVEGLGPFIELEKLVESDSFRVSAISELNEIFYKLEIPKEDTTMLSYLEMLITR